MRLTLDRRAQRLLRRLPVTTLYSAAELALIALLAIQAARLVYAVITPVGPVGDWRADGGPAAASPAILGLFDPFFRLSDTGGPVVVTGLNLKLFGVRSDQASGRGSAIIGLPDGSQASYSVGDEIMPGVTLKSVSFDGATILRGTTEEQIYLDQSAPATVVAPGATGAPPGAPLGAAAPPGGSDLAQQVQATARMDGGTVTGLILQPRGSGAAFAGAGLQPGDILVSVNGERITSAEAAEEVGRQLGQGMATVEVERGGRIVTLVVGAQR